MANRARLSPTRGVRFSTCQEWGSIQAAPTRGQLLAPDLLGGPETLARLRSELTEAGVGARDPVAAGPASDGGLAGVANFWCSSSASSRRPASAMVSANDSIEAMTRGWGSRPYLALLKRSALRRSRSATSTFFDLQTVGFQPRTAFSTERGFSALPYHRP